MAARKREDRFGRLEAAQRETNRRLGRIEDTLATSSRIFELMNERLEHLENGQERLIETQERVIARLDLLVEGTMRAGTASLERFGRIEDRLDRLESSVFPDREPR